MLIIFRLKELPERPIQNLDSKAFWNRKKFLMREFCLVGMANAARLPNKHAYDTEVYHLLLLINLMADRTSEACTLTFKDALNIFKGFDEKK